MPDFSFTTVLTCDCMGQALLRRLGHPSIGHTAQGAWCEWNDVICKVQSA